GPPARGQQRDRQRPPALQVLSALDDARVGYEGGVRGRLSREVRRTPGPLSIQGAGLCAAGEPDGLRDRRARAYDRRGRGRPGRRSALVLSEGGQLFEGA